MAADRRGDDRRLAGLGHQRAGQGYELRVIASTVIGGANLMGGEGGAYGAFIGAALIEVIRNSLLMAGVDANWQGAFVGVFIVLAVLLERIRGRGEENRAAARFARSPSASVRDQQGQRAKGD